MKPTTPSKVKDVTEYWTAPPPESSARCKHWVDKINNGWKSNIRISQMGYHEAAEFFGVYIWEYLNVVKPLMTEKEEINGFQKVHARSKAEILG